MPRFASFAQQSLTVRAGLRLPIPTELNLTGLSSSSYTADPSGLLFVTLDSPAQAQQVIRVMYQGLATVGTASSRVRLALTRQSGGGVISTDYLGFFDSGYVSTVAGNTIRVGGWDSFERSDITSYHSQAAMASGSVTNQAITSLSVQTGLIANSFDYLVIAGGGGGGAGGNDNNGGPGGGGAGGYRTGSNIAILTGVDYTISVGGGGAAYTRGTNSFFSSLVPINPPDPRITYTLPADGGGHGGRDASGQQQGASGGSGGGGGGGGWGGSYSGGSGTLGQGNNGGSSNFFGAFDNGAGGGGGGAGGVGADASGNSGGNGGIGAESPISGSVVRRAGGGGGRNRGGSGGSNGTGGAGGGGNAGSPGSSNTGGGGGALSTGGSGVIIFRYPSIYTISNPGGGLSFTTNTSVSGVKITTFTAGTGTIRFA